VTTSDTPAFFAHAAMRLERAGRVADAVTAYEQLLARWPDLPECWYNLAVLQRKARRFDDALASYRQALDRGVSQPEEVHLNRGVIYADFLRRDADAAAELHAALALNPRYEPALLNLANLQEDLGRRDEALALYEQLLDLDPECHVALARYVCLRTHTGVDTGLLERLRRTLARDDLHPADRASLGFALGQALDKGGFHDEAFATYCAANGASRASAGARGFRYDRQAQERLVTELIETFGSSCKTIATGQRGSVQPIFICGMFRSGSTLTEQVLAGHPLVSPGGELDLLPVAVRTELAPFPASMAGVASQRLEKLAASYLDALARLAPAAQYVTDKRPDNFLYIGLIKALFPDARIVHTVRNAYDTCLSIFFQHLDHSMAYALDLADIGHYYRQYLRLMEHWRRLYGADILDFDYDDFVRAPRPAASRLLEFCGLAWAESCLAFQRRDTAVKTASVWQVRESLHRRSSGRSRHYAEHLRVLDPYLQQAQRPDISPGADRGYETR
jgi:tetratricopeptide (TPR) repeat protein